MTIYRKFILSDGNYDKISNTWVFTNITKLIIDKFGWEPKNEHQIRK